MSDKALALIFLNLSGEMLYVLDQRLFAQKITTEKGKKSKLIKSYSTRNCPKKHL